MAVDAVLVALVTVAAGEEVVAAGEVGEEHTIKFWKLEVGVPLSGDRVSREPRKQRFVGTVVFAKLCQIQMQVYARSSKALPHQDVDTHAQA